MELESECALAPELGCGTSVRMGHQGTSWLALAVDLWQFMHTRVAVSLPPKQASLRWQTSELIGEDALIPDHLAVPLTGCSANNSLDDAH